MRSDFNDELISPTVHWTKHGARREHVKLLRWLNGEVDVLPKDQTPSGAGFLGLWRAGQVVRDPAFVRVVSLGRFEHRCVITPNPSMWGDWLKKRVRQRLEVAEALRACATPEALKTRRAALGTLRLDEDRAARFADAHFESVAEQARQKHARMREAAASRGDA